MPEKLAELADVADSPMAAADVWHELAVANPTFLLERLGSECTDLQGLRELTVNGLDAIAALGADRPGRVVWDLDWKRFEESGGGARKLSVIDTGTGMTAEQLRHYINQLAASGREQSSRGNFGVGAKVAAGSRNPHGLEYRSWHQGEGSLVCFKRDPDGRWGLEPQRWADGRVDYWRPLGDAEKPWLLRGRDHGTQVVLLGQHERHDTTQAPPSVTDGRRHWITRYLAGRFLRFPSQVEVLVHEHDGPDTHPPRRIHGEQHHLEHHAVAAGTVALSDAIVRWWVLDDDHRARGREAALRASSGHAAAVFDDELYDVLAPTRGGYGRLQDFGIRFGNERVVLHIEPQAEAGRVQCNTARTTLLLDHEPLRWARWGGEFAAAMPGEILRLQQRAAGADCGPRREAIRSRVGAILPLHRPSRYRPTRPHSPRHNGPATTPPANESTGLPAPRRLAPSTEPAAHPACAPVQPEPDHSLADSQAPADDGDDDARATAIVDLPDVAWISARDATRAPGDLEDQAARYHPARHELMINADFRAITDLLAHWRGRYRGVPGADAMIEAQVREWCEQVLVEVVLAGRNSHWSAEQLDALLSPSSFTAALLPRQLLRATLQRRLGQRLGAPRSDHAESIDDPSTAQRSGTRSRRPGSAPEQRRKSGEQAT
ncbi:MAG: ATP-binding protein [Solirubrobacteraceae bacterium]